MEEESEGSGMPSTRASSCVDGDGLNGGLLERAARKCELDGLRGSDQSEIGIIHRLYNIVASL